MLLPNACADDAAYEGADGSAVTFPFVTRDSPLLPNLGVANIHGYLIDVMVRHVAENLTGVGWAVLTRGPGGCFMGHLDDGHVRREGAHGGRDDGRDAVRGVEDCGD